MTKVLNNKIANTALLIHQLGNKNVEYIYMYNKKTEQFFNISNCKTILSFYYIQYFII